MCNNDFYATQQLHIRGGNLFPLQSQNSSWADAAYLILHPTGLRPRPYCSGRWRIAQSRDFILCRGNMFNFLGEGHLGA